MKSIRNGVINYVSFVRTYDMQAEAYNVKLEKVVGSTEYNFYGIQDISDFTSCNDFITLLVVLSPKSIWGS